MNEKNIEKMNYLSKIVLKFILVSVVCFLSISALLAQSDITINDLVEKIKANNLNVGAQFIEKDAEEFVVRSVGLTQTIEDINDIVDGCQFASYVNFNTCVLRSSEGNSAQRRSVGLGVQSRSRPPRDLQNAGRWLRNHETHLQRRQVAALVPGRFLDLVLWPDGWLCLRHAA